MKYATKEYSWYRVYTTIQQNRVNTRGTSNLRLSMGRKHLTTNTFDILMNRKSKLTPKRLK